MTYAFLPDYPATLLADYAVVRSAPVWGGNINGYEYGDGRMHDVRALVLHTPEEAADNDEVTPRYFATVGVNRSTHDYIDNDGDLYQMVSHKDAAWGHGVGMYNRTWKGKFGGWAPWNKEHISNNQLSIGVEIEGFAGTIDKTLSRNQYATVARWIAYNCTRYSIPLTRDYIVGHYELATDKTDPGKLPIDKLIESAKMLIANGIAVHENYGKKNPGPPVVTEEIDLRPALRAAYRRGRDNALRLVRSRLPQELSRLEADLLLRSGTDELLDEALQDLLP